MTIDYLDKLKDAYVDVWELSRFSHNGNRLSDPIGDACTDFTCSSFGLLNRIVENWSDYESVRELISEFYCRHNELYSAYFGLSNSRLKSFHLGRSMAFTAGLGPAFRAAVWAWKDRLSVDLVSNFVKAMLIHDVHKRFDKVVDQEQRDDSLPELNGPELSLNAARSIGVALSEDEVWLVRHHDLRTFEVTQQLCRDRDRLKVLCLVKLFDRCDKPVLASLRVTHPELVATLSANVKKRFDDTRLTDFFRAVGKMSVGDESVEAALECIGLRRCELTIPDGMTHLWETPDQYVQMLSLPSGSS